MLSGTLWLRAQSRSRVRLRSAASIAFLFRACFEGVFDTVAPLLDAHDCGYPLSRYTCRATRVAADFLDFIAFRRCSTGVALHPLKSRTSPPHIPGGVAPKFGSEKASRYTGVSQPQLRVSRYTVQLRRHYRAVEPPKRFRARRLRTLT